MSSRGLVSYNKQNTQHLCRACQLGKQTKLPSQRSTSIVTSPFDIIHSDIWTSSVSSMSGYKYYVLFLDHYSHFLWVYPLHRKSDAQSKLLHFRTFVKIHFNREIKAFQCDHGGEFDNNPLHELFATNGIQFRFSCPCTSQQNGKSERMIRTINNVVHSLLFQARLPPEYLVEALLTAAYLLNILPSTSINNDISYTKLFNKPTSYTHLRTFGCLCYPYTFSPHKLSPRITPSIFLGYPYNHHGYRCLDLNTNKIIISRHVKFEETVFPCGFMTLNQPPSCQFLDDNLDTSPIAFCLLTTPTSPQQTPPQTTPQATPPTPLPLNTSPPPPPSTSQHPRTPVDTEKKLGPEGSPLCLYMHDPREPHLNAIKRVLRYLRGTTHLGLQLFRSTTSQLIAYSDADWAGCPATRRSTFGYCVFLGDNLLTWSTKREDTSSRYSVEAEYRGFANAIAETSWIHNLLRQLHTLLFTATLYAYIFTKGLPYPLFTDFRSSLSVRKSSAPTARAY
nr:ribonuclease H-like domain-containing protein [Tanacetum cinerariifolium]